ncbi:sugar transferase [Algimonas arctica]|uniref:sugar transferase n=1 Tax=Algimonas arctica TaxID=1479486 RepID=UPI001679D60B|nr:sugar transferase [Algimonas arctica]
MLSILKRLYPVFKRTVDRLLAALLLLILFPVLVSTWIAVKLTSKGPGLFWSSRIGRDGDAFRMPKFRSMTVCSKIMAREVASNEDFKMTPIGNFLRRTSLDELPQLLSIVKGDMSFIGPRPLLPCDDAITERAKYSDLCKVRPGITGLAQINGRNSVSPRKKARYDAFYARKFCLVLDAKIVIETLKIIRRTDLIK